MGGRSWWSVSTLGVHSPPPHSARRVPRHARMHMHMPCTGTRTTYSTSLRARPVQRSLTLPITSRSRAQIPDQSAHVRAVPPHAIRTNTTHGWRVVFSRNACSSFPAAFTAHFCACAVTYAFQMHSIAFNRILAHSCNSAFTCIQFGKRHSHAFIKECAFTCIHCIPSGDLHSQHDFLGGSTCISAHSCTFCILCAF